VVKTFRQHCVSERMEVDWSVPGVRQPDDYVDCWRILLWDKAFVQFFGQNNKKLYSKKSVFKDYPGAESALKRVLYRCVYYLYSHMHLNT
jgi:hypothetical protein